ncbi:putative membrane protein [Winogradskyella epiphytica]|uniref:Putative membrane protein n=1 Tax=Winogradskyella epiphytica TaxID=262005 RepID=A0A2V4WZ74_9FLAO|nr:DUF2061 domain-containing protein [Winogradskyella epiphytica]PYE82718.1 putative membrane protein [Winogradskyella epiphytica]
MKFSKRHAAKTLTWRLVGTLDTMLLSWLLSGDLWIGLQIGGFELATKSFLYYMHERFWYRTKIKSANKRHIFKTFSWRCIGTLDTILLGWLVTGSPLTGLKIGTAEVFTKMLLYFVHEKLWYRINFGLDKRIKERRLQS